MYGLLNHKILIIKGEKNVSLCKNEAYSGNFEKDFAPIAKVIRMNSYARSALAVAQRRLVIFKSKHSLGYANNSVLAAYY